MRILFVNFNIGSTVGINNGLAILSAVLKRKGHEVRLIFLSEELGYGFDLSRIRTDVIEFGPGVLGFSLMEPQFKYAQRLCQDVRGYFSGVLVCGGPFPTMDPESVIDLEAVDAVCIGEGEDALCELVDAIERGRNFDTIHNLWVKRADGTVVKNPLRPFKDLSTLPPEDKFLFDLDKILPLKNYQLETMLGRGCIYKCSYCINDSYVEQYKKLCIQPVTIKDYTRIKSVDTVIQEIREVILRYPKIRKIAFIDDNFLMYNNFVQGFYARYSKEIGLPFMCNINPMSFNYEKGKFLKEAGCDDIRFGIESGSERLKKEIMRRPISNQSVINAFEITMELNLMSSSFNMIGLPTESPEEVFETLSLNAQVLPDTIKLMTFYPFKNTPIYDTCVSMNLIDYEKKRELDDYDTATCLRFPPEHRLFLKKIQIAFNWYINIFLNNEGSEHYKELVKQIEKMEEETFDRFDFLSADKAASKQMKMQGIPHYSKFANRSLSVKFPSKHLV